MANAQGVNAQQYAQRMYEIVAPAIKEAVKNPDAAKPYDAELAKYLGSYSTGFGGETAVVLWEDGLATLSLPTTDPVRGLNKLRKTGENTFRRVRKDDALGETIVFEIGPNGTVSRMIWNSNYYSRLR